jgi:hypothetical protein
MMCRYVRSQRGFSIIKTLLFLIVLVGVALYFLPHIGGDTFSVVNQISGRVKGIGSVLSSRVKLLTSKLSTSFEGMTTKVSRRLEELLDRLNLKKLAAQIAEVREEWETDMTTLIDTSKSRGFDMGQVQQSYDEYNAEQRSWKRVESLYWEDLRSQTQKAIEKSFQHFLTQPVGCSDYTVEFKKILAIGAHFNEDTFDGYSKAKELSEELYNPRSLDFTITLFEWFRIAGIYTPAGRWEDDWFIQQLTQAIGTTGQNSSPDYPNIIQSIERQTGSHQVYRILGAIVIAEIYLNHNLVNSTLEYYDEAIRNLYTLAKNYDSRTPYSYTTLGIHMALGLMNERMCSNNDLAIKEFKDVIAIANRLGLSCEQYNEAHYHLAVMNLQIRERATILPQFTTVESSRTDTVGELLPAVPTQTSETASAGSGVITGTIGDENSRSVVSIPTPAPLGSGGASRGVVESVRTERPAAEIASIEPVPATTPTPAPIPSYGDGEIQVGMVDVTNRRPERDIRLVPRQELGDSVRMNFTLEQLYDLSKIPDDAAREFEWYLKCQNQGDEVDVARYVLNEYLGK